MDNLITGTIAVVIFLAFVLGLAESIDKIPFTIIVVIVSAMLCFDYYQSVREGLKQEKNKKSRAAQ
jgi:uncharacterized membrane protein